MRQETNKEIDLLLRRMSRTDGSLRDGEAHEQHLDVDELSSYAQNALPAKTRARYTEHLAECSSCRKLVTELSLSLGATTVADTPVETVVEASGLKKFLASLLSPMVLRYAVPALGLIIVAAIGFAILRQPAGTDFVAQVDTNQRSTAPLAASPEAPAPTSSPDALAGDQAGRVANSKEVPPKTGDASGAAAGSGPGVAAPAPAPVATPAPVEDAPPPPQTDFRTEPKPAAKTTAPVVSEEKTKAAEDDEQRKDEQRKKDAIAKKQPASTVTVQAAETPVKTANEPARDANAAPQTGTADRVDESKREALPVQRRGTFGSVNSGGRARAQSDKENAETRTVSGRRFRKERGIWTDTAYDSSTATVNVGRGSEQFRALVADEPEIKKIAEQLDGEVIVVWKGRAYRIR